MLDSLWKEYQAFKIFFVKFDKSFIIILVLLLSIPYVTNLVRYNHKRDIAFLIYPELLGNINEVAHIIDILDRNEKVDFTTAKFVQKDYDKHYDFFGKSKLDIQLKNFYSNLNRATDEYGRSEWQAIKSQGDAVSRLLTYYFGCKDYHDYLKRIERRSRIVSGDTVVAVFNIVNFWRFNRIAILWWIASIMILLVAWFMFYERIRKSLTVDKENNANYYEN